MTTIAFDGQYVAADKGIWANGHIDKTTKIRVTTLTLEADQPPERMIAVTYGSGAYGRAMLKHYESYDYDAHAYKVAKPDWRGCEGFHADTGCLVLVTKQGVILDVAAEGWIITMEGHGPRGVYAAGGGREMALGALLAGASAQRAVEIAIEFSDYGGHGVTVHSIGEL